MMKHDLIINELGLKKEKGHIVVDKNQKTSMEGIFAVGDCTNNKLKQVITACVDGTVVSTSVYEELKLGRS